MPAKKTINDIRIKTERLELIAATVEHLQADMRDHAKLSRMIEAQVPRAWPPALMVDAYDYFLQQVGDHPHWQVFWYWVCPDPITGKRVLIGNGGFKAIPDESGMVETGYSVMPEFHGHGYASEAERALIDWAFTDPAVTRVEAETTPDNLASQRVLEKNYLRLTGAGFDEGSIRFVITRREYEESGQMR